MIDPEVLKDYITSSGLRFHSSGQSYIFTCPLCQKPKKLYIRKRDGLFTCWYCNDINGFRGRPEFALAALLGVSVHTVRESLYGPDVKPSAQFLDYQLIDFFDSEDVPLDIIQMKPVSWLLDMYPIGHPHARRGEDYLLQRGISIELANQYDIHYWPRERRVCFPVKSGGKLFGWQARTVLKDVEPKIRTSDGLERGHILMFGDHINGSDHAVLTEGPVDAIKAHLCGGNVATMGKQISPGHLSLLRNSGISKLYVGLDPDAGVEIKKVLQEFVDLDCYWLRPPSQYKDLGEMSLEEVLELFRKAPLITPGFNFAFFKRWY